MKLVSDEETGDWIENINGNADDFDWDDGNAAKNLKHGVAARDIRAMWGSALLFEGRIADPQHDEPRWLLLGKERTRYEEEIKKESH